MERVYASDNQQPGFYLKCGMHWVKLTNYGRADWVIADADNATRLESLDVAQALQSLFNNRDRGLRALDLVEAIAGIPVLQPITARVRHLRPFDELMEMTDEEIEGARDEYFDNKYDMEVER
jgi:hypothetical protein